MKTVLITGANGEIGHELIDKLSKEKKQIVTLDINRLDEELGKKVKRQVTGDILDSDLVESLFKEYKFDTVFHLAAMLSTSAERDPVKAHHVNTDGAINLLSVSEKYSRSLNKHLVFVFPSSIAVYGLPNLETSKKIGKIKESEWNNPATMYGCNKLYIELLGNYYERYFEKDKESEKGLLDFRCLRFPGLLSANTLPTGGTSDFGPEILHHAAQGKAYECFVRADTKIPFMTMPDAVKAMTMLAMEKKTNLKHDVYNVGSFNISAKEIVEIAKENFENVKVTYKVDQKRQAICDSWPRDVNDEAARKDWGWKPDFDLKSSFDKYLLPAIEQRYSSEKTD